MKKQQSGFTLIELMIVVAIIGILAAIAVPQYQNFMARSQAAESVVLLNGARTTVEDFVVSDGNFVADLDDLKALGVNWSGTYGKISDVDQSEDSGTLTYTIGTSGVNKNIQTETVTLARSNGDWSCATSLKIKYAPKGCASP
jgi:type IV pilus assembly protein PilA